jgi:hypothetical protein
VRPRALGEDELEPGIIAGQCPRESGAGLVVADPRSAVPERFPCRQDIRACISDLYRFEPLGEVELRARATMMNISTRLAGRTTRLLSSIGSFCLVHWSPGTVGIVAHQRRNQSGRLRSQVLFVNRVVLIDDKRVYSSHAVFRGPRY